MSITAREVSADEVRPLRLSVLRPGAPHVPSEYDERPGTRHVAACDGEAIVGCATVFPSAYEGEPDAWQLRGMAVLPDRQRSGVGAVVIEAAVEVARSAGAPLLWANARVSALPFYESTGWAVVGEEFTYGPQSLPHKVIVRDLRA